MATSFSRRLSASVSLRDATHALPLASHPLRRLSVAVAAAMGLTAAPAAMSATVTNVALRSGATGSSLSTSGATTTVNSTLRNGAVTAFNAFSDFTVAQNDTVNLVLPTGAKNLVNIVDNQAVINGVVNSYIGSVGPHVGGHVFFADPAGLVLGATGTINVGALSVAAVSARSHDALLADAINGTDTATTALLKGTIDHDNANVTLSGTVNATQGVRIQAHAIDASGTIYVAGDSGTDGLVTTVNTGTPATATDILNDQGIRLQGANITLEKGSVLHAAGTLASANNDVTLTADVNTSVNSGSATSTSSILIDGTVIAANVVATATAEAISDYADATQTLTTNVTAESILGNTSAVPIGQVVAASNARVEIGADAVIHATGNVNLLAQTHAVAATSALSAATDQALVAAAIYGQITGATTAQIDSGAQVNAGGALTVEASHAHEMKLTTTVNGSSQSAIATAIGYVDTDTTAAVATGAVINAGSLSVLSNNQASYAVESTVKAPANSPAAINAAILLVDTTSTAIEGANLGSTSTPIGAVTVSATSTTSEASSKATTAIGQAASSTPVMVASGEGAGLGTLLQNELAAFFKKADAEGETKSETEDGETPPDEDNNTTSALRAGMSVSLLDVTQHANASIAANAVIKSSGNVVVNGNVTSAGTSNAASTATTSSTDANATVAASVAVAVGLVHNDASAVVGSGAQISAVNIGVNSSVSVPWNLSDITTFSLVPSELESIYGLIKGSGQPLTTSYANATSDSNNVGLAGAVSYFSLGDTSTAWVDANARLTTTGAAAPWSATVALGTNPTDGTALSDVALSFAAPVDVNASNKVQTIEDAGNFSLTSAGGTNAQPGSSAVGGGVNIVDYGNTTLAGIGTGAVIDTTALAVNAQSAEQLISVTPTAGKGGGVAGNVIFAMADTDDTTHASISSGANINAGSIGVTASESLGAWSIAGAIAKGTGAGIGVGVAIDDLSGSTQATIGDNSADALAADASNAGIIGSALAAIHTNSLNVTATTDGSSGAIGFSGAAAKEAKPDTGGGSSGGGSTTPTAPSAEPVSNSDSPGFITEAATDGTKATSAFSISGLLGKLPVLGDLLGKAQTAEGKTGSGATTTQTKPSFGLALSGSSSVNMADLDTQASVSGVSIGTYGSGTASTINVQALNETSLISAAGAGALAAAGKTDEGSVGIAGAVSYSEIDNTTVAELTNVTALKAGAVTVQALSGGSVIDLGLGLAANTQSDADNGEAAGSFSITQVTSTTTAAIDTSTLASTGSTNAVQVDAYDRTDIGAGGGSLALGGNDGIGAAVTYSDIASQQSATIDGGSLAGFGAVTVQASDAARIASGAASIAASKGSTSTDLSGAFVVNIIHGSTSATIDNGASITDGHGDVTVTAQGGGPNTAYDSLLTARGVADSAANMIDFSGGEIGDNDASGAAIFGVAGSLSVGGNSGGLSFAYNSIADTYAASIVNAAVNTTGNVAVSAIDDTRIIGFAVGIGGSTGDFAGVGSATANLIDDTTTASVGDATGATTSTITANALGVNAVNGAGIDTLAGNVTIGKGAAAAGLAISYNAIGEQTSASISHTTATTTGTSVLTGCAGAGAATSATACSTGAINSAAVGIAGSTGAIALTASLAINDIGIAGGARANTTSATIAGDTLHTQGVSVQATDSSAIQTLAGAVALSEDAGAGAGFAFENIGANTSATLSSTNLAATGAVAVDAATTGSITAIAVGGAVSGDIAFGGSLTDNDIANQTLATVSGVQGVTGSGAATLTSLDVSATDSAAIRSLAGALSVGVSGVGIGGASSIDSIASTTSASLTSSDLTASLGVTIDASATAAIQALAAVGAGGADAGIAGAVSTNDIDNTVTAQITGTTLTDTGSTVRVDATNGANILSSADSVAVSGGVSAGAAIATNRIGSTVSAQIEGGTVSAKDVLLAATGNTANSDGSANIRTLAAGVGGGQVGTAASLAINIETGSVAANIGGGATVTATDNVGVTAANNQSINVIAGSLGVGIDAVGLGLGTVVDELGDSVTASVTGSATHVNAQGSDATDMQSVTNGTLAHTPGDLASVAMTTAMPNMAEGTKSITGLAITAQSEQAVTAIGVSAALAFNPLGSAAISAMVGDTSLGGSTNAYITDASVNRDLPPASAAAVDVTASSQQYAGSFIAGIAGGVTDFSGAAAVDVTSFSRTTQAYVDNTTLSAGGPLNVDAYATQRSAALATGLSGSIVGGAATGITNRFADTTSASIDRGSINAGSIGVLATSENDASMNGGSAAFGAAALAGTMLLSSSSNTTDAFIGDTAGSTTLNVPGQVTVAATSTTDLSSLMVSGAGAGGPAIAGMAAVTQVGNHTNAYLDDVFLDKSSPSAASLGVTATETINLTPHSNAAAASLGAVGAGAAANVVLLDSQVGAAIQASQVFVSGTTNVLATSNKTIDALTISGALGADAGISGATSVIVFGNGSLADNTDGSNPNDELNKNGSGTLAQANSFGSGSAVGSSTGSALDSSELTALNNAGKVSLLNSGGNLNQGIDGTTASIVTSLVDAGSVTVNAVDNGSVKNLVGNAAGGIVGAGGAVAISVVNDTVGASVDSASYLVVPGAVNVTATVNNGSVSANGHAYALDTEAYQGAFGFVGLGAAVAYSELDNTVSASFGGGLSSASALDVAATDNSALYASGGGAVGGGLAAGVVVSQSDKSSTVQATTGANSSVSASAVNITATDGGRNDARAVAVGAGLLAALNGADANATDSSHVLAKLGAGSTTTASGSVTVSALDTPTLDAEAFGVAVSGGVSIGASVATTDLATHLTATTGDNARIVASGLTTIQATQTANSTANATGGAGGALVGANASLGTAQSTSSVTASTGNNVTLPAGALDVFAHSTSNQTAGATGVGIGFIGVGASVADADANSTTVASLGSNNTGAAMGAVSLSAIGTDSDTANAVSGSGGVISGSAAVAHTSDTAVTTASVGAGTILAASSFNLNAVHNDDYIGTSSAVGAGLANASGAGVDNVANSTVGASVGANTGIFTTGFVTIGSANNFVDANQGVAVQGGGGGVLSGAAALLDSNLTGSSTVSFDIDSLVAAGLTKAVAQALATRYNDQVFTTSGNIFASSGAILISAGSSVYAQDTATLDSGGLVAGSGVSSNFTAHMTDAVTLAASDQMITNGDLGIGTYSQFYVGENALTHTYGGGAQGSAIANTTLTSTQNVDVGAGDTLLAFGQLRLTAGEDATGTSATSIDADANAQAYVRGIIAIATGEAHTTVNNTGEVTIALNASALAGGNVTLGTYLGTPKESAEGTGHGYELGFIPITQDKASTGGPTSGTANIFGTVIAGVYANSTTTIDANGNVTHTGAPLYVVTDPNFSPYAYIAANSGALSSNTESDGNTGVPTSNGAAPPSAPAGASFANSDGDAGANGAAATTPGNTSTLSGGNAANVDVASILDSTVTQYNTTALELGSLYAAGGNVTLHTDHILGNGSVTANGSPNVTVTNNSPDYLVLSSITIPDATGGQVLFTGDASAANAGSLGIHTKPVTATPTVSITSTWDKAVAYNGESITQGPAIFLGGEIDNDGGLVAISNVNGSVGQFAPISAQQITESVPNGAVAVYLPDGTYHSGSDPIASFAGEEINLGDANSAVNYVINAIFNPKGAITNATTLTQTVSNQAPLADGYAPAGAAYVFFGNCAADAIGDCSDGTQKSFTGSTTGFYNVSMPTLQVENLSKTVAAEQRTLTNNVSALNAQIIAVQAKYIDIDSAIVAGHATTQTVTINPNFSTFAAANLGASGLITVPASYWSTTAPTTAGATPLVQYNASTGVIVVNNINASGGGFVTLDGGIISTAAIGAITINDGYGHVTINNLSSNAVQIADINTGNNALGELKITDTNQIYNVGGNAVAQTHWYVNQAGVGTTVYDNSNGATEYAAAHVATSAANGATLTYTPAAGLRYEWQEQTNLSRAPSFSSNNQWTYVDADGVATSSPVYTVTGTGVITDTSLENTSFKETITGSSSYGTFASGAFAGDASVLDVKYHGCDGAGSTCHYGFRETGTQTGADAGVYQYIYEANAQLVSTSSVKADYGISINFSGNATGNVSVNSNAGGSILLTGSIYNPGGTTSLAATGAGSSITAGAGSSILTNGLTVSSGNAIGTAATPLNVTMTGGTLTASTGSGGVFIDAQSPVTVNSITAANTNNSTYGDVSLSATGSITGASPTSLISGGNITLKSIGGGVGSTAVPLDLYAHDTLNSIGGYAQGVVNISAVNDIGIVQTAGDLQVGAITSAAGNVSVKVPTGSIVDAADVTSGQALSAAQLATVSADLHLTDADGASTAAYNNTIVSFQAAVDANYQSYWQFRQNGTLASDGAYTLTNVELYRGLAAASAGVVASTLTDAQINAYAQTAYAADTAYLSKNDVNFGTGTDYQSFNTAYAYTASAAQQTALTANASYTTSQLTSAINSAALTGTSDPTQVGSAAANITGHTVDLSARYNIGALGQTAVIDPTALTNGTLSQSQLAALAAANGPGDVKLVYGADGTTITEIDVGQTQPLFLSASGVVSATNQDGYGGSIYLQANEGLALGNVHSAGNVVLLANGSITDTLASPQTPVITAGGDLTLISGNTGSIGGATAPISYQIGGTLVAAKAGQDVAVEALGGNLDFGAIVAGGTATLIAQNASIFQVDDGLSIKANSIDLVAGGNIGYLGDPAKYLELQTGTTGTLYGSAGGYAMLYNPTAATELSIGSFTAVGPMTVTSAGKLNATSLQSGGALTISSGDDAVFGTLASVGDLSVASLGDLTVQSATSAMASGTSIRLDAAGAIDATNNSGLANLTARPDADVILQAGSGIGAPMVIDATHVTASSSAGDIDIAMLANLASGNVSAALGSATLTGTGNLDFTSVTAAHDANVTAVGAINGQSVTGTMGNVVIGAGTGIDLVSATSGGSLAANAGDSLTLGNASAGGGLVASAGTDMHIGNGAITGNAALTAQGGMTLGNVSATQDLRVEAGATAANTLTATDLHAGRDMSLTGHGDIDVIDQASAGGSLGINAFGALAAHDLASTAGTTLSSGGSTAVDDIEAGTTLTATAGTSATVSEIRTGDTASIVTGTSLDVADSHFGGSLAANAGTTMHFGTAAITGDATLTSLDALQLDSVTVSQDLTATAGALLTATDLQAGRDMNLTGHGDIHVIDQVSAGRSLGIMATGALAAHDLASTADTALTTGSSAAIDDVEAGTTLRLNAGTSATVNDIRAGDSASIDAGTSLDVADSQFGGNLVAHAGTTMHLGTAAVTGNATLTSLGAMQLDSVTASQNLTANADALTAHDVVAGSDMTLVSNGDTTVDKANAGVTFDGRAGNSATYGVLTSGGGSTITAGSALDITTATVGDSLVANAGSSMHIANGMVTGNATLTSLGGMTMDHVSATEDLTAEAGASAANTLKATDLQAGRDMSLTGHGDIDITDQASAGRSLGINGTGALAAHDLASGADTRLTTGSSAAVADIRAGSTLVAMVGSSATVGEIHTGDTASIDTGTSVDLGDSHFGGSLVAKAGTTMHFGTAAVTGDATLTSLGGMQLGTFSATHDLTGTAGSATIGSLNVGNDALLTASDTIELGSVVAGRDIYGTANNDIGFGTLAAGRDIVLTSRHGHVQGTDLTAARTLDATAGTDIDLTTTHVGNDATLTAGNDIALGTITTVNGSLTATSGRDFGVGSYDINGDVTLESGRDMSLGSGTNTGTLNLSLGGNLDFTRLTSQGLVSIDAYGGSIHGGDLITDKAFLGALNGITLDTSHIGTQLNLAAADIDAHVVQTTTGQPITMYLTGYHNGIARQITMDVQAPSEWLIQRLAAVQAVLDTSAPETAIIDGKITGDMWLTTPQAKIYMNNVSPTLVNADEQLYEPGTTFDLWQAGNTTLTDAFVSRYTVGFDVTAPNYVGDHLWTHLDYYGGSVLRYLGSTITLHGPDDQDNRDEDKVDERIHGGARGPNEPKGDDVVRGVGIAAVNLGAPN